MQNAVSSLLAVKLHMYNFSDKFMPKSRHVENIILISQLIK